MVGVSRVAVRPERSSARLGQRESREVSTVGEWWFPAPPHIPHSKFIAFSPSELDTIFVCIEQGALLRSDDLGVRVVAE